MNTFFRFLYEFLSIFFLGLYKIISGIVQGLIQMFSFGKYVEVIKDYKADFNAPEWILVALSILILIILLGCIVGLIYFLFRKYFRFRKTLIEQESLLDEIGELSNQVQKLMDEKEDLLAMQVSKVGIGTKFTVTKDKSGATKGGAPGATATSDGAADGEEQEVDQNTEIRFPKLNEVDLAFEKYKIQKYNNSFDLPELCYMFRNFANSHLGLFYSEKMIKLFIAAMASTKILILQGISGTGKTSLAYAWGKFLKHDSCVASVQPSWRDRTELFGYFNEFTKKFNETDVLKELYEAGFTDDVYTVILDEMNIARVEYYFAEMLSILEMPNKDEWLVEVVPSSWPKDPKRIVEGKLKIPANVWYIGTINNDDSTFMVTDKVYDRAMPIDINERGTVFKADDVPAQDINYSYLNNLYEDAIKSNPISDDNMAKVDELDDYIVKHFRVAIGNRIIAHMRKFVPVYVACGGTEVEGLDYFIARKILRKFEQLNSAYIRDEVDGFIDFLNDKFGNNAMEECIEYLLRLKKIS